MKMFSAVVLVESGNIFLVIATILVTISDRVCSMRPPMWQRTQIGVFCSSTKQMRPV